MSIKSISLSIELIKKRLDVIDEYLDEIKDINESRLYKDAIIKNLIDTS